ncbi:acetyl-CoA carboxylase biotin carboxylase subunit family protein [Virgibacillus xinjiangensis]|uniref:Acetyl-CoA carboxylase biotin carboxylase subunit family protein n=1 Tax=Virgibacillus xinjiangensis TaxID=393090 RepID=A0ABV7CU67_9BACI
MVKTLLVIGELGYKLIKNKANNLHINTELISTDQCSTSDYTAIIRKIESVNPDVIISRTDPNFEYEAIRDFFVAKKFPHLKMINTGEKASLLSYDKALMRHYLIESNIPISRGHVISSDKLSMERLQKELSLPIVIKQIHSSSGQGVFFVNDESELNDIKERVKQQPLIVEEFIEGNECGLEVLKTKEAILFYPPSYLGVTDKENPINKMRSSPYQLEEGTYLSIKEKLTEFISNHFDDFVGILQFDLIVTEQGWFVNEMNARISGLSHLNSSVTNLSPYDALVMLAAGKSITSVDYNGLVSTEFSVNIDRNAINELSKHPNIQFIRGKVSGDEKIVTMKAGSYDELADVFKEIFGEPNPSIYEKIRALKEIAYV